MSLAEQANLTGSRQGMPCSVATLLEELDATKPSEAEALRMMLDSPWRVWGHTAIEEALEAEGYSVGTGQIGKHRRKRCRCRS